MADDIPGRLVDRFEEIDRRLLNVETDVKTRADAGVVVRELETLRDSIRTLKSEYADDVRKARDAAAAAVLTANQIANDVIRAGRSENLKLIGIVIGAFTTICGGIIAAVATGKI